MAKHYTLEEKKETNHYSLVATNTTDQGWHFGLYQKPTSELGFKDEDEDKKKKRKTIAWKVLSLSKPEPENDPIPTSGNIPWDMDIELTVPETEKGHTYYKGRVSLPAVVGNNYELVIQNGYPQIIDKGEGTPGFINYKNNTYEKQHLGLMVDGSLIAMQPNVDGGATEEFEVSPTYYCGMYTDFKQGAFVNSALAASEVQIKFKGAAHAAHVTAQFNAHNQLELTKPKFSHK